MSAPVHVSSQTSNSLNLSEPLHGLTQRDDSLLEILQSLKESYDSVLESEFDRIKGPFPSKSVPYLSKKV